MSKDRKIDKIAEYTIVGKKITQKTKKSIPKSKKAIIIAIISCVLIVSLTLGIVLPLYYNGYFEDFFIGKKNEEEQEVIDYTSGFHDYTFSSTLPKGKYATFMLTCDGKTYSVQAYLLSSYAPNTVSNFITYANAGYYNNTVFTNATITYDENNKIAGGFLLGGAYEQTETGVAKKIPTFYNGTIEGEFKDNGFTTNTISNTAGTIAMSREENDYDSAVSEFFFNSYDNLQYNGKYAVFAKITNNTDIEKVQTLTKALYTEGKTVILKSVSITESK